MQLVGDAFHNEDDVQAMSMALEEVAKIHPENTIAILCRLCHHRHAPIRLAALRALTTNAQKDDEIAIATVCACAQDERSEVRQTALILLMEIAS